jgi:hypothetical protein
MASSVRALCRPQSPTARQSHHGQQMRDVEPRPGNPTRRPPDLRSAPRREDRRAGQYRRRRPIRPPPPVPTAGEHSCRFPSTSSPYSLPWSSPSLLRTPAPPMSSSFLSAVHGWPEEEDEFWRFCRFDPVIPCNPLGFSCVYAHLQETPYKIRFLKIQSNRALFANLTPRLDLFASTV